MIIKLLKKIIPILSVILLCMTFSINTYEVVAAPERLQATEEGNTEDIELTLENARERLAVFAEDFAEKKGKFSSYAKIDHLIDSDEGIRARAETYKLSPESNGPFRFDCVGWVSYAIHWALSISYSGAESGLSGFITNNGVKDSSHFAKLADITSAKRGDILIYRRLDTEKRKNSGHVAIYLGINEAGQQMIADCRGGGVKVRKMSNWQPSGQEAPFQSAATLSSLDGVNFGELPGGIDLDNTLGGSSSSDGGSITAPEIDLDDIIMIMDYDGMPPDASFDGGHSIMYYIEKVSQVFNYLIGIMFNGIKVAVVGLMDGVQSIITNALEFLSGIISGDDTYDDEEFKFYTIEELIFNKVPALNVNVFNNTDVEASSITMNIRNSIATWYVTIRNISIVCLGFAIIYIGLKLAISTVASDKANYKKMLINWITAILIVYFIHIIVIFVLNINDALLKLFYSEDLSSVSIYETIRTRVNDLRFITWLPALIIYSVLFIYSLMFLWIYIKRFFTILILIVLAPLVGVKYAIDSAGKGQKSKILSTWLYEFTMNVLLQSLHALIYTVLMGIAVDLATTSILGFIIALVFINFILKADKIFMNIFKFSRSKLVGDVAKPLTNPKEEFGTAIFLAGTAWNFAGGVKDVALYGGKQAGRLGKKLGKKAYLHGTDFWGSTSKKYKDNGKDKAGKKVREDIEKSKNNTFDKIDNTLNKVYKKVTGKDSNYLSLAVMSRRKDFTGRAAKKQLRKAKSSIKARYTAPFKFIKSAGGGVLKIGVGIPLSVVNLGTGIGLTTSGTQDLIKMGTKRDKKGNRYTGTQGLKQAGSLGAYGTYKELKSEKDKLGKTVGYFNKVVMKEDEIEKEFKNRFEKISKEAIDKYKKELKFYITYGNKDNVNMIVRQRMAYRGVSKISTDNIDDVIEKMADDMFTELKIDDQYSKEQSSRIKKAMIEKAKDAFNKSKENEFGSLEMANSFSDAIRDEGISKETDIDNIRDMTSRFIDKDMTFEEANLESSVDKVANEIMKNIQMEERASKQVSTKMIADAKKKAKEMYEEKYKKDPKFNRLSTDDVARSIYSSIKSNIEESNAKEIKIDENKFGFGSVTNKFIELHDIKLKAQKDVKVNLVKENKFIDTL